MLKGFKHVAAMVVAITFLASSAFAATPIVEYKFDETGTTAPSTGSDTTAVTLYNASNVATDLHSASGTGISGVSGDRALNLTAATGMGSGFTGPYAKHLADDNNIDALQSLTVSGWFKTAGTTPLVAYAQLLHTEPSGNGPGFNIGSNTSGILLFNVDATAAPSPASYSATQQWVFFAVTYDGGLTSNNVKYYIGSSSSAVSLVSTTSLNMGATGENTDPLWIGNQSSPSQPFDGYLDNIRIYGSKTNNSGVLTLADLESVRAADVVGPLILEYKFNEIGTTAPSTGSDATAVTIYNASNVATDLHSVSGTGISGQSGDRALNLTAATGMGSGFTGPYARHLADDNNIDALKSFTVAGWFKTDGTTPLQAWTRILHTEPPGNGAGFNIGSNTSGILLCNVDGNQAPSSASYAATQQWVFFAVSYDGTLTSNNAKFYVGSTSSAVSLVTTASLNMGPVNENTDPLWMGNHTALGQPFDGYLDNIRIYGSKTNNSGVLTLADLESVRAADAPASGYTHTPANSAALTAVLNGTSSPQLQLGDTIVLNAGTTYTGSFTLPNLTTGSGWVTIKSSAMSSLPGEGVRVKLADAPNMPKILSSGVNLPAIKTAPSAHHFKLIGLEIIAPDINVFNGGLVWLGETTAQTTLESVPQYLVIDRCIVRAYSAEKDLQGAISLNSGNTDILNSHISSHYAGAQCYGIAGSNGTGPFNIINNYIEAAGINFIIGGDKARIPGVIPENIVFHRNHCAKRLEWRPGHAQFQGNWAGSKFTVVNLFEFKFGRNFDIQGNIFENTWKDAQNTAAVLKVDGNIFSQNDPVVYAAKIVSEDIIFAKNIIRHAPTAITLQGRDWAAQQPVQLRRLDIRDNLCYDISSVVYASPGADIGSFIAAGNGGDDVTIENNTCFQDRYALSLGDGTSYKMNGFIYRNNITRGNPQWNPQAHVIGASQLGSAGLAQRTINPIFAKNVITAVSTSSYTGSHLTDNWFPANFDNVLANYNNGVGSPPFAGWKVKTGSVYENGGTDGQDIGCDIDAVVAETAGCESGVWP